MDNSVIFCDEFINAYMEAKSNDKDKSYEETKFVPVNFNEIKQPVKCKTSIFYLCFYYLL